jgi:hypothetical protein
MRVYLVRKSFLRNSLLEMPAIDKEMLKGGVQGKYSDRYKEGTNLILLDHDVAEAFPTDEAVNEALRLVIQLTRRPRSKKKTTPEGSTI